LSAFLLVSRRTGPRPHKGLLLHDFSVSANVACQEHNLAAHFCIVPIPANLTLCIGGVILEDLLVNQTHLLGSALRNTLDA
jgi:hypothetical protein